MRRCTTTPRSSISTAATRYAGKLGFGWGPHLCIGAPLARLEGAHVLNAMLDRIPRMRLAPGFRYERVTTFMMRGPVRLDVEIDA